VGGEEGNSRRIGQERGRKEDPTGDPEIICMYNTIIEEFHQCHWVLLLLEKLIAGELDSQSLFFMGLITNTQLFLIYVYLSNA
jgi:hypothetical protein